MSVTGGAHRLWAHRSFEAHQLLRWFFAFGYTIAGQESILNWCHGHRVHHKWSDTDSDPHTTSRGFIFAHFGWIFATEHPDVARAESRIDISDLWRDPVVRFHHRYYRYMYGLTLLLQVSAHVYFAGDSLFEAIIWIAVRIICLYHEPSFVNSAAHMFGDRPYNPKIAAAENIHVSIIAFGEGKKS